MPDGTASIPLAPRRDIAARHVELLTGSPDTPCCFRLLGGMGNQNLTGRLAGLWWQIEGAHERGTQVFIVVNEGGHNTRSITRVRALFVDGDSRPTPTAWHAEPDFIVRRDAMHWHAYWLVAEMPLAEFKAAQKRLAAHYGTDAKVCDLPRLMRLAGTLHLKDPSRPLLVTIEADPDARFPETARSVAELMAGLEGRVAERLEGSAPTGEPVSLDIVRDMLGCLDPGCDRDEWRNVIAAIHAAPVPGDDDESGRRQLAQDWSQPAHNYAGPDDVDRVFDDLVPGEADDPDKIHFGSLVTRARAAGYTGPISIAEVEADDRWRQITEGYAAQASAEMQASAVSGPGIVVTEQPGSLVGSESDLASGFAQRSEHRLRYVEDWGRWLAFDGRRWAPIATPAVWNTIDALIRPFVANLPSEGWSSAQRRKLLSKATISGVEQLARGKLLAQADQFDADPWLLNTPAGIVDLRTGELHRAAPEAYCTKLTAAAPGGDCPLWRRFLAEITGNDAELQAYLQRLAGYSLVGQVIEHVLIFLYGTGANGKGVFLGTLAALFGDYAKVAPIDTFTDTTSDRHPTDMAMLRGMRLVTAQETDEGRAWAEAKIKALTGGDKIAARFMRQDFFEFTPQFTLLIAGNHKPRLRNVDEAIRRRLHMVPFAITIPADDRDPNLPEKLKAEWPGILQWAIDGCREWRRVGLAAPAAVTSMTADYFETQDPLSDWLQARCDLGPLAWTSIADLYRDYLGHMNQAEERPEPKERFSARLESRGFRFERKGKACTRGYAGIKLQAAGGGDGDLPY